MARPSNRDKILSAGLRVINEQGYAAASVRDIVKAAGATLGSFTNHFASKEAFALEIIELYFLGGREAMQQTLLNEAMPPLDRLPLRQLRRRGQRPRRDPRAHRRVPR